jgi:hypothetical protein
MTALIRAWAAIWDWIDDRYIVRRLMTLGTFGLCVKYTFWAFAYAETADREGSEIALILGAIGTPLSAMMGFMFAAYKDSRKGM